MASQHLIELLERANTEPAFRMELERNPEEVLSRFNLTEQEKAAVLSRRTARLRELGVDIRLAKGFAVDNGAKIY